MFPWRRWHTPTAPRGYVGRLPSAEMSASPRHGRLGVSTTRGRARRGASPSWIEARGQGLKQSPLPAGTRTSGACAGLAIVHLRSASGGGRQIPPDTRHLYTRAVSTLPLIGHRPGRTQKNLALRGAARSARRQREEDRLASPRGRFAQSHHTEEG